jgi:hypothetical protein
MLLESGEPKIMDFGVARMESSQLTGPGHVFGTPRYMAPEQALGETVDGRADLFALGSVAYYLLTGSHAFGAPSVPVVLQQVISHEPVAASALTPGLPPGVDDVLHRALAKSPSARYARGREMAEDVDDILAGRPPRHAGPEVLELVDDDLLRVLQDDAPSGSPSSVPSLEQQLASLTESTLRETRRRPWLVAAAGLAVIAAAGLTWPRGPAAAPDLGALPAQSALIARASSHIAPPAVDGPRRASQAATSAPAAAGPARLRLRIEHPLKQGRLRLWSGDRLLLDEALRGQESRHLGLFKRTKGSLQRVVELPAGDHRLRVEVAWSDGRRSTSVAGRFAAGSSRQVRIQLAGSDKSLSARIT